ncbi:cytidine deaminase [Endozoicomonas sp. Mp262]|uniref:cytidine deaminase n=1 Tax=Endozoicomonas sp. Mp262 TaxID=2919499 RepID=UPI0021DB20AF
MIAPAFHEQLSQYPANAVAILNNLKNQQGRLDPDQLQKLMVCLDLSWEPLLKTLLTLAASLSTNPVSRFAVGAIVEGYREHGHGPLYFGANLEMAGHPLKYAIHAEQAAVCNAWHQGETRIRRLIVNETPCGHCRQFLNELNEVDKTEFIVSHIGSEKKSAYGISDLLPDSFGPADLGQEDRLLSSTPVKIELPSQLIEDELAVAAARAASASYAPYSGCNSGIALRLKDGRIITGRYAANAAFNPGMPAIESALVNWRLANLTATETELTDAVLVEKNDVISHKAMTEAVLADHGIRLRYIAV